MLGAVSCTGRSCGRVEGVEELEDGERPGTQTGETLRVHNLSHLCCYALGNDFTPIGMNFTRQVDLPNLVVGGGGGGR